jgi:hypothetical protein
MAGMSRRLKQQIIDQLPEGPAKSHVQALHRLKTRKPKVGVYTPATTPVLAPTVPVASPTDEVYGPLQAAFRHFNAELFANELSADLFTLQRRANSRGYFHARKFVALGGETRVGEIAMNPAYFAVRTPIETCSTLVHEMVHAWREQQPDPPRNGYHDRQWAAKMRKVGLEPSTTGAPGGKATGYKVSHYIVPGGPFEASFKRFAATGQMIGWGDAALLGADQKPASQSDSSLSARLVA